MTKPKGYGHIGFRPLHKKSAKLTGEQVFEIRRRYMEEGWTQGALSREFGVSVGHIGRIVRGENWIETAQVESSQSIADAAAESFRKLKLMQEAPLQSEEKEAEERKAKLLEQMQAEVGKKVEVEKELEELKNVELTKPNPYY